MVAWTNRKWARVRCLALAGMTLTLAGCGPLPLSMAPCTPETFFSLGKRQSDHGPYIQRCPARYLLLWQAAYDEGLALAPLYQGILDASASRGNVTDRLYGRAKLSEQERDRLNDAETRLDQEVKRLQGEFERRTTAVNARLSQIAVELKWSGQTHDQGMQPTRQTSAKR